MVKWNKKKEEKRELGKKLKIVVHEARKSIIQKYFIKNCRNSERRALGKGLKVKSEGKNLNSFVLNLEEHTHTHTRDRTHIHIYIAYIILYRYIYIQDAACTTLDELHREKKSRLKMAIPIL